VSRSLNEFGFVAERVHAWSQLDALDCAEREQSGEMMLPDTNQRDAFPSPLLVRMHPLVGHDRAARRIISSLF
jgi:hypothetical protein